MSQADLNLLSERVIGCAMDVSNALGAGFLEKVYENALLRDLIEAGLHVRQQASIKVIYKGSEVGDYFVDLLVEESLLVELKAVRALDEIHVAQCLNYLRGTGHSLCLLLNFGRPRLEVRRVVHQFQ